MKKQKKMETRRLTCVLARLVVEPHSDMTSLMVIMLYWWLVSHTGDRMELPPLARLCSRSVRSPRSSWVGLAPALESPEE